MFHSLIIGVAVGVITEDVAQVRALLIALSFHQWLEVRRSGVGGGRACGVEAAAGTRGESLSRAGMRVGLDAASCLNNNGSALDEHFKTLRPYRTSPCRAWAWAVSLRVAASAPSRPRQWLASTASPAPLEWRPAWR